MYGAIPYAAAPYAVGSLASSGASYENDLTDGVVANGTTPLVSVGINFTVPDAVVAHTTLTPLLTAMLSSIVHATTPVISTADQKNAIHDVAGALTHLLVTLTNEVHDTAHATTTAAFAIDQLAQIVDAALVSGACTSVLAAKNALVEMVFATDNLHRDWPVGPTDLIHAADAAQSNLVTAVLLVDHALAQAAIAGGVTISLVVQDGVAVSDPLTHILAANESITDTIVAVLTFRIDGDVYTGVVLNTETAAASEYTNFPFNSLAPFAGKYYGCSADGIYLLEGSDDAGTPIDSFVRTGLIRVADGKRARVPTAYFGYTSTGDLVMKVITTWPDGNKTENWYRLQPRDANAPSANRVKIGRGLSSVYWSYELRSVDGAQFGLDTIQLYPMPLERRI